jgi:hypothetical protein
VFSEMYKEELNVEDDSENEDVLFESEWLFYIK